MPGAPSPALIKVTRSPGARVGMRAATTATGIWSTIIPFLPMRTGRNARAVTPAVHRHPSPRVGLPPACVLHKLCEFFLVQMMHPTPPQAVTLA